MSLVSPALRAALARKSPCRLVSCFLLGVSVAGCGSTPPTQTTPPIEVAQITINNGSVQLEKGYHLQLTSTVKSKQGVTVNIPVVYRSTNETVATIDLNGRLVALDTGTTVVVSSALSVNSAPIQVRVVFLGPAKIATYQFNPAGAVSAGATPDSIRVQVTDRLGNAPAIPARVAFAVTGGGGLVSPAIATTDRNGFAAAEWKLGPTNGVNTVSATVLGEDDKPFSFVSPNVTSFSLKTFDALAAVEGDKQTGQILSALPSHPSVKLLDSLGRPRPGVPVTFSVSGGGQVASAVVSTGADGIASPGVWTLGDIPGDQALVAKVEFATVTLHATATGTPVFYQPSQISAGGFATCALQSDATIACFGTQPLVGDGTAVNRSTPTLTAGAIKYTTVAASPTNPSHFCAIGVDQGIYCWGTNSIPDTAAATKTVSSIIPAKYPSSLAFTRAAPGQQHNCAIATDQMTYCWGDNSAGQLGDRTLIQHLAAAPVFGGFKFTSISSGVGHSCGVTTDGSVFCWGQNPNGQLGDGTTSTRTSPTAAATVLKFQSVAAGGSFTCGLTVDGRAYCWGNLGTGASVTSTPKTYASAPAFTSLTAGALHACALTADGTAYCWGNNQVGQLGDSTLVERANPTAVATTLKFKSISGGYAHTCAITTEGSAACWGANNGGELGDSTSKSRLTPKLLVQSVTP